MGFSTNPLVTNEKQERRTQLQAIMRKFDEGGIVTDEVPAFILEALKGHVVRPGTEVSTIEDAPMGPPAPAELAKKAAIISRINAGMQGVPVVYAGERNFDLDPDTLSTVYYGKKWTALSPEQKRTLVSLDMGDAGQYSGDQLQAGKYDEDELRSIMLLGAIRGWNDFIEPYTNSRLPKLGYQGELTGKRIRWSKAVDTDKAKFMSLYYNDKSLIDAAKNYAAKYGLDPYELLSLYNLEGNDPELPTRVQSAGDYMNTHDATELLLGSSKYARVNDKNKFIADLGLLREDGRPYIMANVYGRLGQWRQAVLNSGYDLPNMKSAERAAAIVARYGYDRMNPKQKGARVPSGYNDKTNEWTISTVQNSYSDMVQSQAARLQELYPTLFNDDFSGYEDYDVEEYKNSYARGGNIHIKPENRGKFTALKERTGHSATWFKEHGTPAQRKMATFALNARHWKHSDGGPLNMFDEGGTSEIEPEYYGGILEPSIVTAQLPSKFRGSQAAARRYAEGYKWGRKLMDQRDAVVEQPLSPLRSLGIQSTLPEEEKNRRRAEMIMRYSGGITSIWDAPLMRTNPGRMLTTLADMRIDGPVYSGQLSPKEYLDTVGYSNYVGTGRDDGVGLDVPESEVRSAFQANDITKEAKNDFVSAFFNGAMPMENTAMVTNESLTPFYSKLFGRNYPRLFLEETPRVYQIHPDTLSVADELNAIVNNSSAYHPRTVTTDNARERTPWYLPGQRTVYYDAGNNTRVDVDLNGVRYSRDSDVFDVENIDNRLARPFTRFITRYGKPYIMTTPWYVSNRSYEE